MLQLFFFIFFLLYSSLAFCQISWQWTQKANFGGGGRGDAYYFSIGNKGYAGGGFDHQYFYNDLWKYNADSNIWTQKTNFPGTARWQGASFSIGAKGYIGLGNNPQVYPNGFYDLWEYDTSTDSWVQKADFPPGDRSILVAFSIGIKGYVGTGHSNSGTYFRDFWEFDPALNSWTQVADLPAPKRCFAMGFSIGSKGYCGTGMDTTGQMSMDDFWEYDPATNSWTQKTNYANSMFGTGIRKDIDGAHFTICNYRFIGTGAFYGYGGDWFKNDFYRYNPADDTWLAIQSLPSSERIGAIGFSLNNKGFVGTGFGPSSSGLLSDLWELKEIINASIVPPNTVICQGDTINLIAYPNGLNYLWSTGETTQSINVSPSAQSTYSVIVYDCAAGDTAQVTITVGASNGATILSDTATCSNSSINLQAYPQGANYLWSTGSTASSITILASTDTMIWVYVTNNCGLSDTDSAFISVNPTPEAMISTSDSLLCTGNSTLLLASPNGMNYLWNTGESTQIISVNPDTSTTFSVAISNSFGCSDTDSVFISSKFPSMNLSIQDISFCDGNDGSITVIATDGNAPYSFSWSNGENGLDSLQFVIDSLQTGDYSLTVTDAQGCFSVYAVTINDPPPPVVTITKNDISCTGKNDGTLSALTSGGEPPFTYLWNTGSSTSAINELMPGNYSVTVYDSLNCSSTQTETITEPPPVIGAVTGNNQICKGETILLTASGGDTYQWNTGDINTSINASPDSTTLYSVVVSVGPCNDTSIFSVMVNEVQIDAEKDTGIYTGGSAALTAVILKGNPPFIITWEPGNIPGENIMVTPPSTTFYVAHVTDANGCTDADTVIVRIILCGEDVFVPNAFSPACNCPDSKLKVFSDCIAEMEFRVFDRWGENVFKTKDKEKGWDGKYKGKDMNAAVYVYYLLYTTIDQPDVEKIKKGNINLLR